jgi:hypothetical protein
MSSSPEGLPVEAGEVISLIQRSARRREYDIRAGSRYLGTLQWRTGRRSVAQAEGAGIGLAELSARGRSVVVTADNGARMLATVSPELASAVLAKRHLVIHTPGANALRWRRTGRNCWDIRDQDQAVLDIAASQGLLRASARITACRVLPQRTAVLLALISGFLALRELQSAADASAATGGIVATSAG